MAGPSFFEVWGKESPASMQAFMDFAQSLPGKIGLDEKTFQLIYIALQAQNGAVGSVAAHTGLAKKAGASKQEVVGAVLTTLMLGINGVADCLEAAIEAYDKA
jgi:AhpD family alkylhydroperoxidase